MKFVKFSVLIMAIVGQAVATGKSSGAGTQTYGSSSVNYGAGGTSSTSFGGGSAVNYGGGSSFTSSGFSDSTSSRGSSRGNSFTSSGFSGSTSSSGFSGGFGQNEAPQPYNFDYQAADEQGNSHYHRAEADASGTVRGSYGYTDIQGLYRIVDYIADASGFRASIRTNEPGTDGKESPADVQMTVDQAPAGIQDRYTTYSGTGGFTGTGGSRNPGGSAAYSAIGQLFTSGIESKGSGGNAAAVTGAGGGARSGKSGY
ncbi:uncharacterized transmembrane protein DDB_G0289901-like [Argiope bruennichi]|uniref:uncharacterized transmembrane protein DDB_G0289901-like n=1 Tax=Argiope bruennichi TaxID=94029 RepID=UPI002494F105|nr:uncharacterized transmembrane protein DDB_G0289901-like [Argiope bruennichi]